jgi:hypothetical protein
MDFTGQQAKRQKLANQDVDVGADVTFGSVTFVPDDWKVETTPNALSFDPLNDIAYYTLGGQGFSQKSRSVNAIGGVGLLTYKSRGARSAPTAVLNNDRIIENSSLAHDGTSYGTCTQMFHEVTENWTPSAHGGQIRFLTVDNGTTALTDKLIIGEETTSAVPVNAPEVKCDTISNDVDVEFNINGSVVETIGTTGLVRSHGQVYVAVQTANVTTITVAGTYVDINVGTATADQLNDFVLSGANALQYTGSLSKKMVMSFNMALSNNNAGNVSVKCAVFKNGTIIPQSEFYDAVGSTLHYPDTLSNTFIEDVATNDVFQVRIANNDDIDNLIAESYHLCIRQV